MPEPNSPPEAVSEAYSASEGYPVKLTKAEARLLLGMLANPAYFSFTDYQQTITPLVQKLRDVL